MKKICSYLVLLVCSTLFAFTQNNEMKLIYTKPANNITETLILGNGRLGAMVYGGVKKEKISLNDDNFWSGEPKDWNNAEAPKYIPQVREALLNNNHELADKLIQKMQGPYNQSYQPLGELQIEMNHADNAEQYMRTLDLQKGVATVSYTIDGVVYKRTAFVSYPNQMIAIVFESSSPRKLNFRIKPSGAHQKSIQIVSKEMIKIEGKAPAHVDPNYLNTQKPVIYAESLDGKGMNYVSYVKFSNEDGSIVVSPQDVHVKDATRVIIYITARTSYNGFNKSPSAQGADCEKFAFADMEDLGSKSFAELLQTHVSDFQNLFDRVEFVLNNDTKGNTMDDYVSQFKEKGNSKLTTLIYQLGRYVAISGSRPGCQPLNLQGIWNEWVRPPWSSNYTMNINTQMNYWPVLSANLAECHQPLLSFVEELAINGAVTAKINYNAKGWLAHHNTDVWRQSAPVGNFSGEPSWANFMGGGIWLSFDFWEHFQYTQDLNFLRSRAYPLIRGAVEFSLDWLIRDSNEYLVPPFSVSSEAAYITPSGYKGYTALNTGQDIALYSELFRNYLRICEILDTKDGLYDSVKSALMRIVPYQVDEEGKIKEWLEPSLDRAIDGNRNHLSHLIGFYPGCQLANMKDDKLRSAVRRTLDVFGAGSSGWMHVWEISLWARLNNGKESYRLIKLLLDKYSPNTVNYDGGYQIDWLMGYTAGINEMLVQSHETDYRGNTIIKLLPALPEVWTSGHLYGIRARGGFELDLDWENGAVKKVKVSNVTNKNSSVIIQYNNKEKRIKLLPGTYVDLY